jgi:hypothetical protein
MTLDGGRIALMALIPTDNHHHHHHHNFGSGVLKKILVEEGIYPMIGEYDVWKDSIRL